VPKNQVESRTWLHLLNLVDLLVQVENDQDRIQVKDGDDLGKIQHKALSYLALYPSRGLQKSLVIKQHHKRCS